MNNINAFCVLKHKKKIITIATVCHIDWVCHGMFAHITSTFYFFCIQLSCPPVDNRFVYIVYKQKTTVFDRKVTQGNTTADRTLTPLRHYDVGI
jgi:hypothetical protein